MNKKIYKVRVDINDFSVYAEKYYTNWAFLSSELNISKQNSEAIKKQVDTYRYWKGKAVSQVGFAMIVRITKVPVNQPIIDNFYKPEILN